MYQNMQSDTTTNVVDLNERFPERFGGNVHPRGFTIKIGLTALFQRLEKMDLSPHERGFVDDCARLAAMNRLKREHEIALREIARR